MANNTLIIDERQTELGNFIIGRLLPFRKKRQVGPFTFIDHIGPAIVGTNQYVDVDQHPHTGLSTLTYLFQGQIEHRDSTGSVQVIKPGDVGFMTAGSGVSHTERTPSNLRDGLHYTLHGYQIWVALPKEREKISPSFRYFPKEQIPSWQEKHIQFRLVAGMAFEKSSPIQGYSPMFMVDILTPQRSTISLKGKVYGEIAFVIVKGHVIINETKLKSGQMLISKTKDICEICLDNDTQILLSGGKPLNQEPFLLWNFVSHSKSRLKQAKQDWINKKFPKVPDDDTYIPFPKIAKLKSK